MPVTEALFPNYLFARFELAGKLRLVRATRAVTDIVHFGNHWPCIPETVIAELRAAMGPGDLKEISQELNPTDAVEIAGGAFHGLEAVVSRVMPGRQRVAVLLDFLGRQTVLNVDRDQLVRKREIPL